MRPDDTPLADGSAARAATTIDLKAKHVREFSLLLTEISSTITEAITQIKTIKREAEKSKKNATRIKKILTAYLSLENSIKILSADSISLWSLASLNPFNDLIEIFYKPKNGIWTTQSLTSLTSKFELDAYKNLCSLLEKMERYQPLLKAEHFLAYAQEIAIPKISISIKKTIVLFFIPKIFKAKYPGKTDNELINLFVETESRTHVALTLTQIYAIISAIKALTTETIRTSIAPKLLSPGDETRAAGLVAARGGAGAPLSTHPEDDSDEENISRRSPHPF